MVVDSIRQMVLNQCCGFLGQFRGFFSLFILFVKFFEFIFFIYGYLFLFLNDVSIVVLIYCIYYKIYIKI